MVFCVCLFVCVFVCVFVCLFLCLCVCLFVCLCVEKVRRKMCGYVVAILSYLGNGSDEGEHQNWNFYLQRIQLSRIFQTRNTLMDRNTKMYKHHKNCECCPLSLLIVMIAFWFVRPCLLSTLIKYPKGHKSQEIALGRCSLNVFAIAIVFVLVLPLSSFFSLSFCWFGEAPLTLLICKIYLNSFCPQMGSRGGGQPSGISHIIPFFQSFYIFIMLCSPREWWMFGWWIRQYIFVKEVKYQWFREVIGQCFEVITERDAISSKRCTIVKYFMFCPVLCLMVSMWLLIHQDIYTYIPIYLPIYIS